MTAAINTCLIGFGEVGQALARDLANEARRISAWDLLFADSGSPPAIATTNARKCPSAAEAVRDADIVISAVTAAQTIHAADSASHSIKPGAWYIDLNSASPGIKITAANIINSAGGRYIEAAVMSPIHPKRITCPMLFGGPHAEAFMMIAATLGFAGAEFYSSDYGKASAAKICRSVIVKGVEALLTESLLTARHYGVEETVVDSLSDLFPGPDWKILSKYMISRALEHGKRRAEEMREAAKTVAEAGLSPLMSSACAERQDLSASFAYALGRDGLPDMLDAILDGAGLQRPL